MSQARGAAVLIVGGGAVGVSTTHHLVEEAIAARVAEQVSITLVERRPAVGPGIAYEADVETNLLNTRAAGISAIHGNKPHFYEWLRQNEAVWRPSFPRVRLAPSAFLPRALFGLYLQDLVRTLGERARRAGIDFTVRRDDIVDIARLGEQFHAATASGATLRADVVMLCCGHAPHEPYPQFARLEKYASNPYPIWRLLQRIDDDDDVIVVGSRLSAIDVAIALLGRSGYRGAIKLVSRGGRLPAVRGSQEPHVLRHIVRDVIRRLAGERGGLRLEDVLELCRIEAESNGVPFAWDEIRRPGVDPRSAFLDEIYLSADRPRPWQGIVYAMNEVIDEVWRGLREDEKQKLVALKSEFLAHRVSIPIENACIIARALAQGRATLYGGLERLGFDDASARFRATLRVREANDVVVSGAALINATGFDGSNALRSPLLQALHSRGLLRPHRHGGIDVEFESGRMIASSGAVQPDLFAIGSLTSGVHFFTSALDINVRHAARSVHEAVIFLARRVRYVDEPARHPVFSTIGVNA